MARWTYAFSNGNYNDWHRKYDGIAMIDVDSIECCPRCYEPLAVLETCYDKGQKFKATTLVEIVGNRLKIPQFLVFYKKLTQDTLSFRIKRLWLPNAEFELMNEDQWVAELYALQDQHQKVCKYGQK
jgi:hypothetical protein|tara:strand:+ start:193 stop:573 length:381 start_codon:yes stop_codon:yes gene_type:complete